jgi:hypothetical protein
LQEPFEIVGLLFGLGVRSLVGFSSLEVPEGLECEYKVAGKI